MKLAFVLCVICLAAASAHAETTISDAFQLTESRKSGALLNGTTTESGRAVWDAYGNVVLGDGFITTNSTGSTRAQTPLAVQSGKVLISCKVTVGDDAGAERWVAIGLSNDRKANLWNETDPTLGGQVYVVLNSNRSAVVFEGVTTLKTAAVTNFHGDSFNDLKLDFDFASKSLIVRINGQTFYSGTLESIPSVNWARIEMQSPQPFITKIDDFRVHVSD